MQFTRSTPGTELIEYAGVEVNSIANLLGASSPGAPKAGLPRSRSENYTTPRAGPGSFSHLSGISGQDRRPRS